jgi:uncharacterized membrane protein YkvI
LKEKKITTAKVAGTYIGTIVGAGFASGQEILQFFVSFGKKGILGLLAITFLFIYFGYIIMMLGRKLKASSHLPIVNEAGGRILGPFSDAIITFFLFGALTAMIAGSGAIFKQEFGTHPLIGSLFMASITMLTVMGGFQGIINSISIVVPFLIIAAVSVSIAAIIKMSPDTVQFTYLPIPGFLRNWLWSAIVYVSYNTVTSISILGPLGYQADDDKIIKRGALLGGLGLGIGAAAIFTALYINAGNIQNIEIPMLFVSRQISPLIKILYSVVLLAEIYTTAVSDLYGFAARICQKKKINFFPVILISTASAFLISLTGFTNLVKYLYPAVGYLGVLTLICLVYNRYKT